MQFIFASSNAGKIAELKDLFADSPHEFIASDDARINPLDVPETGSTFSENALIKAKAYAAEFNMPTLADDSGLEVAALNNNPGVNSNRWHPGSDAERNAALLKRLEGQSNRAARFVTVACLYFPDADNQHYFEGSVEGRIASAPAGSDGFGYDPLFIPEGHDQTFAELGIEVKNRLSHRAQAFTLVKQFLTSYD